MKNLKFNLWKMHTVTLILAGSLLYACQDNSLDDTNGVNNTGSASSGDSIHSGLEGTREQASQSGTSVVIDSSAGQSSTGTGHSSDSPGTSSGHSTDTSGTHH